MGVAGEEEVEPKKKRTNTVRRKNHQSPQQKDEVESDKVKGCVGWEDAADTIFFV